MYLCNIQKFKWELYLTTVYYYTNNAPSSKLYYYNTTYCNTELAQICPREGKGLQCDLARPWNLPSSKVGFIQTIIRSAPLTHNSMLVPLCACGFIIVSLYLTQDVI
uniref:Uncharacterized protein n=1 Tax=Cacopsylla melanoneura TaxID=428564 RepID=A0A8D8YAY1_9HEMI